MRSFASGYERIARVVMVVFVINVAFVAHMLLGAIVAGFFPSLGATFATYRAWLLSADRSWGVKQTWMTFHRAFAEEIGSANAWGWPLLGVGALLVWEYYLTNWNDMGALGIAASGVLLGANVMFGVLALVLWVVRSHFQAPALWLVRRSMQVVLCRPLCTVMMLAVFLITVAICATWPGVFMVAGVSLPVGAAVACVYSYGRVTGFDVRERRAAARVLATAA